MPREVPPSSKKFLSRERNHGPTRRPSQQPPPVPRALAGASSPDRGRPGRDRECGPVHLAAGRRRNPLHVHHGARNEMARQESREIGSDLRRVEVGAGPCHHVGDKCAFTVRLPDRHGGRRTDRRGGGEGRVDFGRFHSHPVDLYLIVAASHVLDGAVRPHLGEVAVRKRRAPGANGSATNLPAVAAGAPWYPRASPAPPTYSSPTTPVGTGRSRGSRIRTVLPAIGSRW